MHNHCGELNGYWPFSFVKDANGEFYPGALAEGLAGL
jgi:hypothetical protein